MTTEQIVGLGLTLLVMLIGVVGNLIPVLPGTPLVLIAAVGHRLYFGISSVNNFVLIVLVWLTLLSLLLDFLASVIGAKKFGATWRGAIGAVLGGLVGLFFALPGIIIGPFLGATVFEMMGGREFEKAAKAGTGAVIGLLLGAIGKFSISVIMIVLFATNVILRSAS